MSGLDMGGHSYGYSGRRHSSAKETASLRKQGMGGVAYRSRLQIKMLWLRTSDYDTTPPGGKKCKRNSTKALKIAGVYAIMNLRDIIFYINFPCSR